MPTYNRAQLLHLAIKSVLQQTFDDFELIVCNGGSTDNTKDVVANFSDKRIRYVETKEKLTIGDNYQHALDHATGEYLTFLSDDDAFVPNMFERVNRVINDYQAQIVAFHVSRYYHDSDFEYERQIPSNTLGVSTFTGEVTKFEPAQCLKTLFSFHGLIRNFERSSKFITPYLANAVYHHTIFSDLKTKVSRLFSTTPADMYLAAAVFFVTDSYHCLDEPLHVWSQWADNATASIKRKGSKLREHYEKLLNGEPLRLTPLKFALPTNCSINAILQAKQDFGEKANGNIEDNIEVDWLSYYVSTYGNLKLLKKLGVDVTRENIEFNEVLDKQPREFQRQVRSEIFSKSLYAKELLLNNIPTEVANFLLKMRGHNLPKPPNLFCGNEHGFNNVLEAATFVGFELNKRNKHG
jgi:glycosyltransferase involved in cell wall biosynthesis